MLTVEHRQQRERADPRQPPLAIRLSELAAPQRRLLDREERPRLPGGDAEPLADIGVERRIAERPIEALIGHDPQQLPDPRLDRAQHPHRFGEARIEGKGVGGRRRLEPKRCDGVVSDIAGRGDIGERRRVIEDAGGDRGGVRTAAATPRAAGAVHQP
ncbi:MAG: hypothetical protein IT294_00485 [Deltaproteobacteria bacterium]|nr:hypothetical protein [Deltaproteobacteria bacterium]